MLHGRDDVIEQIATLIGNSRAGRGGALLITGAPGQGKTALLGHAATLVDGDWLVLRCRGTEQEAGLRYGGLHQLLAAMPDTGGFLPEPAPATARPTAHDRPLPPDDSYRVGLGLLTFWSTLTAERPVLCLIDDAHWWDPPSLHALAFASRRLIAYRSAVLVFAREQDHGYGFPETWLTPLSRENSRSLLNARLPGLPADTRERILDTAAGNPSALLELPIANRDLPTIGPLALTDRLRREYERPILALPEDTRIALLVVAADCSESLIVALRVLTEFGSTAAALDPAERTGVVSISGYSIAFRHPLERAAAYRMAPYSMRLFVHTAIAASIDNPELRAWHLAAAATAPDETAALALEAVAGHAYRNTEFRRAALASERAGHLSPDPAARHRRLLAALEANIEAGQAHRALRLVDEIAGFDGDRADLARLSAARGRIFSAQGDPRGAYTAFTDAAAHLHPVDPDAAARMHVYAAGAIWPDPDLSRIHTTRAAIEALDLGAAGDEYSAVLDGQIAFRDGTRDLTRAVAAVRRAIPLARTRFAGDHSIRFMLALQAMSAGEIDDSHTHLMELNTICRRRGMTGRLPIIGIALGTAETLLGHFPEAQALLDESRRTARDIDQPDRAHRTDAGLAVLAAIRGEQQLCRTLADANLPGATPVLDTTGAVTAQWALGLLDLGCGRHDSAIVRFEAAIEHSDRAIGCWIPLTSDHIEAAARCDPARAAERMAVLERWCAANPASWIEAHLLRCRGLIEQDGSAFARALTLHAEAHRWFDHARTGLLYGEWLRRERSALKARTLLHSAMGTFERLGARPWAERARTELRAAGEGNADDAIIDAAGRLTPQELQVVRLAAAGATNREIAARLQISPKTVSHHLYRAFPKLGVSNRRALARLPLGDE